MAKSHGASGITKSSDVAVVTTQIEEDDIRGIGRLPVITSTMKGWKTRRELQEIWGCSESLAFAHIKSLLNQEAIDRKRVNVMYTTTVEGVPPQMMVWTNYYRIKGETK